MAKKTIKKRVKTISRKPIKKVKKIVKKLAKKPVKKAAKIVVKALPKKPAAKPASTKLVMPAQKLVGEIVHFYPNINVGVVSVKKDIKVGDKITIAGHGRSFEQKVISMQMEHMPIQVAKKGQAIGMKVAKEVKEKDLVYLK